MPSDGAQRRNISSGAPWEAKVGYSRAVRIGDRVVVSGTTASDENGNVIGRGDIGAQTRYAISIIERAVIEAGGSLADIVRTRMYVTDISQWEAVSAAHAEAFANIRPAATMVEVSRLIDPDMLVEIEAEAVIEGG